MISLSYNNATQRADLVRNGKNLVDDPTLYTAVLISLFTRRQAAAGDILLEAGGDREGWWADPYADVEGDLIGSRLWLLSRSKTTQTALNQAESYAREALQWLIDDGVASAIDVVVERQGSMLAIGVSVRKPSEPASRWSAVWQAHLDRL